MVSTPSHPTSLLRVRALLRMWAIKEPIWVSWMGIPKGMVASLKIMISQTVYGEQAKHGNFRLIDW